VKPRLALLITMVFGAAAIRLLPHPPNLTPIAAMALFGGAYFADTRLAFLVPLVALFLSDIVMGLYNQIPVVYGSFALIVCLGFWLQKRRTWLRITAATLASSVLFFITTNFGVWAFGSLYPKTTEGLLACSVAAIPFFRHTLVGDSLYAAALFGGFALIERWLLTARRPTFASA
jgi:hypothetical protein